MDRFFYFSSHKLEQIAPKETNVRLTSLVLTRIFSPHMKIRCVHVQTRSVRAAQWFQTAKNQPKISSLKVISRVFSKKCRHTLITSISGLCVRLTFKICQIVSGTTMIRQFHELFESHFWRVF